MQHANTLYITTQGAYLWRDHATLCVRVEKETRLKVPLHHLEGVVCFGRVGGGEDPKRAQHIVTSGSRLS